MQARAEHLLPGISRLSDRGRFPRQASIRRVRLTSCHFERDLDVEVEQADEGEEDRGPVGGQESDRVA